MRGSLRPGQAVKALSGSGRVLAFAALAAALASACGTSQGSGPLVSASVRMGLVTCVPAPNHPDIGNWYTPIGFALDLYYNGSHAPLTIEAVSLIDPRGIVLHGAMIHEMVHGLHPLIQTTAWNQYRGQAIPGAVMPAENSTVDQPGRPDSRNIYQLILDITARTPHGGWALGERVRYRAAGQTYTVTTYTGYVIAAPSSSRSFCVAQVNAVHKAWHKLL